MRVALNRMEEQLALPLDLSEWFDRPALLQWVIEVIDSLDWNNPDLTAYLAAHPGYHPKMMLSLVTYAYAIGVYEAEEVAELCFKDEGAKSLCGKHEPTAKGVTRFRRENKGLLKWTLVELFKRALQTRFGWEEAVLPAGLRRHLVDSAVARLDIARTMIRGTEEP